MAFNAIAANTESHVHKVLTPSELVKSKSEVWLELIPLQAVVLGLLLHLDCNKAQVQTLQQWVSDKSLADLEVFGCLRNCQLSTSITNWNQVIYITLSTS